MPNSLELFPVPENDQIALVGDTHANTRWTFDVMERLASDGVKTIVQLGDFGWWPQFRFAWKVARNARRLGTDVLFIDGNHEHHANLRKHALESDSDGNLQRPVQMHSHLWYLPRGCSWEWQDVRFRALGGAYSIDQDGRVIGKNWFPEEVPSEAELDRTVKAGPTDVFLTHEYPALGYKLVGQSDVEPHHEEASHEEAKKIGEVARAIDPELIVHGHWHQRYHTEKEGISIEGLNCDNTAYGVILLDLDTLEVEEWPSPVHRVTF